MAFLLINQFRSFIMSQSIVFIDTRLADYQTLVDALPAADYEVINAVDRLIGCHLRYPDKLHVA